MESNAKNQQTKFKLFAEEFGALLAKYNLYFQEGECFSFYRQEENMKYRMIASANEGECGGGDIETQEESLDSGWVEYTHER